MADRHRTVSRVIGILEQVAGSAGGVGLPELARHLGAPRSTVYTFVRGLIAEGYLAEGSEGGYGLGPGAHTLLASQSTSLVELLTPVMSSLGEEIKETMTLAVPVGNELTYVHTVPAEHAVAYVPAMHSRRHLWPTSAGKIFLAYHPVGLNLREVLRDLEGEGQNAQSELEAVRDSGFATNIGETVTDVAAVAVGVQISGWVVGAISAGGPRARIETRLTEAADLTAQLLVEYGLGSTRSCPSPRD